MKTTPAPSTRCPLGFTLLEVLIAVVVLSVGLLGLMGLQAMGLRNNHSAYLRTQATWLSYDMADRMRANKSGVGTGAYNGNVNMKSIDTGKDYSSAQNCRTISCTPAELAPYDAAQWKQNFANAVLPSGSGTVTGDGAAGTPMTITVNWMDMEKGGPVLQSYEMDFIP